LDSGSFNTHENICRKLAKGTNAIVYRRCLPALPPEHPFPPESMMPMLRFQWVSENAESFGGDAARIAVAGDSAGGNLARLSPRWPE
jgi:acetyl esterase